MNNKIVYCWLANGIPFYIGIGNPKRAYTYKGRTSHSTNKRLKAERDNCFEIRVLHKNLTWQQACELEQSYISLYGRKDLGTGILTNMTDGGEGTTFWLNKSGEQHGRYGCKHSKETKRKMAEIATGRTGKQNSRSKPLKTPLGLFESGRLAALAHGVNQSTISKRCRNDKYPEYEYISG